MNVCRTWRPAACVTKVMVRYHVSKVQFFWLSFHVKPSLEIVQIDVTL